MRINYIFRSKKVNEFSIENVFLQIIDQLESKYKADKFFAPEPSNSIINIIKNIASVIKVRNKLSHITGDVHYLALFLKKKNTILTIHDLSTLNNKKGLKRLIIELFWYRLPISKSKYVTTISEKIANDLIEKIPNITKKLFVINNPVDRRFTFFPKKFNKEKPRLLQIGTRNNKNLEGVIKAISQINCILDIVGVLSDEQISLLEKYKIEYENSCNLTNDEILNKYKMCDIVIFISKYEGFGLPIIEGQSIGRVVITSDIEPMKSIAIDSACLVDPYNIKSIRDGISKIISNDNYREDLIKKGMENAKNYHSKSIAKKYQEIYDLMQ